METSFKIDVSSQIVGKDGNFINSFVKGDSLYE